MLHQIESCLKSHFNPVIVSELLTAYSEAKHNFYLGGLRLSAVEGGRFCEAALRILQQATTGTFTPIGQTLDAHRTITQLANLPAGTHPDSIRLHIPRAIRVVYDVRNTRDAAHLADGIDPNLQDAHLVVSNLDWILAEFTRLYHGVSADNAQRIVNSLVTRRAPVIQDFDGFLKILNPNLKATDVLLLLLYERSTNGATLNELTSWVKPSMRSNLRRTLSRIVYDLAYAHTDGKRYYITKTGMRDVESRNLHVVPEQIA